MPTPDNRTNITSGKRWETVRVYWPCPKVLRFYYMPPRRTEQGKERTDDANA